MYMAVDVFKRQRAKRCLSGNDTKLLKWTIHHIAFEPR